MSHHERDDEVDVEEIGVNGLGGASYVPRDEDRDAREDDAEIEMEDDLGGDPPEGDDEVVSGHSPEFQRLTKPSRTKE